MAAKTVGHYKVEKSKRLGTDGKERVSIREAHKNQHEHSASLGEGLGACNTFLSSRAQHFFDAIFASLGVWIAKRYMLAQAIGFLILIAGLPGTFLLDGTGYFLWMKIDFGSDAFAISTSQSYKDYHDSIDAYHGRFHPANAGIMSFSPKDSSKVLSAPFMKDVSDILLHVYNEIYAEKDGVKYYYTDLCLPNGLVPEDTMPGTIGQCAYTSADFLYLVNYSHAAIDRAMITKPASTVDEFMLMNDYSRILYNAEAALNGPLGFEGQFSFPALWRFFLSEAPQDDYRMWEPLGYAFGFGLKYRKKDDPLHDVSGQLLNKITDYFTASDYIHKDRVRVSTVNDKSLSKLNNKGMDRMIPLIFITIFIMVGYAVFFLASQTRQKTGKATQVFLVQQGAAVSGLASFSSFGWMYYFGYEQVNFLCCVAPFLVTAVGVDCTFIYITAMKVTGPDTDLVEATSMALAEGASAVTLTSLTSVLAFSVAAATSTSQTGFVQFNLCLTFALILNYLGFIFFFVGNQVMNEIRIKANKPDPGFIFKHPDDDVPKPLMFGDSLRAFINTQYAPKFKTSKPFKLIGAAILLVMTGISFGFMGSIGLGLPQAHLTLDGSYMYDVFEDFEKLRANHAPLTVSMKVDNLDLGHMGKLELFNQRVLGPITNRSDVFAVMCLPKQWHAYKTNGGVQPTFQAWLATHPYAMSALGRKFTHEMQRGQFSGISVPESLVCDLYLKEYAGSASKSRVDQMKWFQNFSNAVNDLYANDCFPCDATRTTIYAHIWSLTTELDAQMETNTWLTIMYAVGTVAVVLLFALPVHRALVAVLNIFLVVMTIIGFMGYAGITYNLVSYITLTMSIGFCVDYTVEVMHFSVLGPPGSSEAVKFEQAMIGCGYDVLHGCATAWIGVFLLGQGPAEYLRMFSYLCMIMCVFGGMYALYCMPCILVLVDDYCGRKPNKDAALEPIKTGSTLGTSDDKGSCV